MEVLVTGRNGQLGQDLLKCLKERRVSCLGAGRQDFDLTKKEEIREFVRKAAPDVIMHCGAYTQVDRAEEEEALCRSVNGEGTRHIAAVCREQGIKMVYISTDYVFPGEGDRPYETEDSTGPLGAYGRTKLEGELAVKELLEAYFIVRVSWIFGKGGTNFIKTMLRLGKEKKEIRVVADQIGAPTYTKDLAPLLCDMAMTEKYGLYHAANEGFCSWADLAEEVFLQAKLPVSVRRVKTEEYPAKAVRPKNSRLSKRSLDENGFSRLPQWQDAVSRFLKELE